MSGPTRARTHGTSQAGAAATAPAPTPAVRQPDGAAGAPSATARAALCAHARLRAECVRAGARTRLSELVSDGPLALRRTHHPEDPDAAQATLVGAMAAPLTGDRLRITVRVGPAARLRVTSAAATVSLPGRAAPDAPVLRPARYELELHIAEGGVLEWLPEPVIAAAGSDLRQHTRVHLAAGARLVLREELLLGRASDRQPGRLASRLTVRQAPAADGARPDDDTAAERETPADGDAAAAGRPGLLLLDQETALGPGTPGWDGPAVLGPYRALGQLLTTERLEPPVQADGGAAEFADLDLPGERGLTLRTAVAPHGLDLRRALSGPPHKLLL